MNGSWSWESPSAFLSLVGRGNRPLKMLYDFTEIALQVNKKKFLQNCLPKAETLRLWKMWYTHKKKKKKNLHRCAIVNFVPVMGCFLFTKWSESTWLWQRWSVISIFDSIIVRTFLDAVSDILYLISTSEWCKNYVNGNCYLLANHVTVSHLRRCIKVKVMIAWGYF